MSFVNVCLSVCLQANRHFTKDVAVTLIFSGQKNDGQAKKFKFL